jgi:hypothetical protein
MLCRPCAPIAAILSAEVAMDGQGFAPRDVARSQERAKALCAARKALLTLQTLMPLHSFLYLPLPLPH